MASKTISITDDVYNKLNAIKGPKESFSELFTKMLEIYKQNLKNSFGAWHLSDDDIQEFWGDLLNRPGRTWNHMLLDE